MAQVAVTIAGRPYRMACEDGQEPHLEELARIFDAKITEMRGAFGEIGDQRLMVMAAIALADDRADAMRRAAAADADMARLREAASAAQGAGDEMATRVARAVEDAAARIERVAKRLEGG
jgi:cell division protein ZapA